MIDSRAGRVLDPECRSMVDQEEWEWITEHACGDVDHLLIGTSLPLIMGPAMHYLEAWNEIVADGGVGQAGQEVSPRSCARNSTSSTGRRSRSRSGACATLLREVGAGEHGAAPSTICVLSGDVHHAYLAEVGFPAGSGVESAVWQAVCSPFRNPLDSNERRVILAAWTRAAGARSRAGAQRAGVRDPDVRWRLAHDKPWFNNQVAWLEFEGRHATFVLEKALPRRTGRASPYGESVFERSIEPNAVFARA